MGVYEEIFPDARSSQHVQTEWASGWNGTEFGFALAAEYLTKNRSTFGAMIDQVGLAVFFLQRHRVELALKGLLNLLGAEIPHTHSLDALWKRCGTAVSEEHPDEWREISDAHSELIAVLHAADNGSFAYRYPEDNKGNESVREKFIDLDQLDSHIGRLVTLINGYGDWRAELLEADGSYPAEY